MPLPIQRLEPCRVQPAAGCAAGAGGEADDVAAVVGLGEGEGAERVDGGQGGEPAGLLLVGAEQADRGHREAGVHGVEGGDAAVAAGQFGGDEAFGDGGQAGAAVAGQRAAGDVQFPVAGDQRQGELRAFPVVVGHRRDLGVAVGPDAVQHGAFALVEQVADVEEVGVPGVREIVTVREDQRHAVGQIGHGALLGSDGDVPTPARTRRRHKAWPGGGVAESRDATDSVGWRPGSPS